RPRQKLAPAPSVHVVPRSSSFRASWYCLLTLHWSLPTGSDLGPTASVCPRIAFATLARPSTLDWLLGWRTATKVLVGVPAWEAQPARTPITLPGEVAH